MNTHTFLFLVIITSTRMIMPYTELALAQKAIIQAAQTSGQEDNQAHCLCNPTFYPNVLKTQPKAANTPLYLDNGQQTNFLLYAATVCPAATVEQMIQMHLERNIAVDQITYQGIMDDFSSKKSDARRFIDKIKKRDEPHIVYFHDSNLLHLIAARIDWQTPEELAAFERMVKVLTKHGVAINQLNFSKEVPLSLKGFDPQDPLLPPMQLERAKILMDHGATAQWWFGGDPLSQIQKAINVLEKKNKETQLSTEKQALLDKLKEYAHFLAHYNTQEIA